MSRDIGSRPFGVILTAFSAVFICGETDVMVPWRIVPINVIVSMNDTSRVVNA